MTTNKDFKRLVRRRMEKTGESYTAARAQIRAAHRAQDDRSMAELAGISNDAVVKATGMSWSQWVRELDEVKSFELDHPEIAKHVLKEYDVSGWWAQSVVVSYERIKGLRDVGQRRGGAYDANKSKTFKVQLEVLYKAFSTVRQRKRWLHDCEWQVRKSTANKSIRLDWTGDQRVQLGFFAKPGGRDGLPRTTVQIQHSGLSSRTEVERVKGEWAGRLAALEQFLK